MEQKKNYYCFQVLRLGHLFGTKGNYNLIIVCVFFPFGLKLYSSVWYTYLFIGLVRMGDGVYVNEKEEADVVVCCQLHFNFNFIDRVVIKI